jgi:hypothetical protein
MDYFAKSKAMVLATSHRFQGTKVFKPVDDPCYRSLLNNLVSELAIDFVFEEASGFVPTYAQTMAESKAIAYLDVDPAARFRPSHGLSKHTGQMYAVDMWATPSCTAHEFFVADHAVREMLWIDRVKEKSFQSALFIVGFAHGLSVSFRLRDHGYAVRCLSYYKEDRLCGHTNTSLPPAQS